MISLSLAAVALLTAVANGQTVASCQTIWEDTQTNTCSQLGQYEGACNNFYGCLKDSFCQLYNVTLQQTLGGLLSDHSNCTSGTSCRGYHCNSDFVQYYADVVGCTCTFLNDLGATDAQKQYYIALFSDTVTQYCDASLDVGCSGATASITLPRYTVSFTLSIASWNWAQYTQAQFDAWKENLREYIANRLAVWKSQVTINWTYQGSGRRRRRLQESSFDVSIELGSMTDGSAIQSEASNVAFTNGLSSDTGVAITESQAATVSDDTQIILGPTNNPTTAPTTNPTINPTTRTTSDANSRNIMTLVTMFSAVTGFCMLH